MGLIKNIAKKILSKEIEVYKNNIDYWQGQFLKVESANFILLEQIESEANADAQRDYWDNRWNKAPITFKAQGEYYRDMRSLVNYPSRIPDLIVMKSHLIKDTEEKTILAIIKWCAQNITYQFDIKTWGKLEFWADSDIILQKRVDDCDGLAVAFKALCLAAGIPDHKVHIVGGDAMDPQNENKIIGHAYPTYIHEDLEYPVDPTYFADWVTPLIKRKTLDEDEKYKEIWWCFTKKYTFSNKKVIYNEGDSIKKK